jgi:RecB family endonuclease NucS
VPLREVWKREAANFTTWLRDNIDVLNDQLGLGLVGAEREQSAGAFNVDLVAEDADGEAVVIRKPAREERPRPSRQGADTVRSVIEVSRSRPSRLYTLI